MILCHHECVVESSFDIAETKFLSITKLQVVFQTWQIKSAAEMFPSLNAHLKCFIQQHSELIEGHLTNEYGAERPRQQDRNTEDVHNKSVLLRRGIKAAGLQGWW